MFASEAAGLVFSLTVKVVADDAETYISLAPPVAVDGVKIILFGAAPKVLLKVKIVSQVVGLPVPAVMVNEPAESVELAVTAAVGVVPQLIGVPIVGAVV